MTNLYQSSEEEYILDLSKIFSIVYDLHYYCNHQTQQSRGSGRSDYGIAWWQTDRNMLMVNTERRGPGDVRVTLADLVLSHDNKELKFKVYSHTHLMADPQPLIDIAEQYKLPKV